MEHDEQGFAAGIGVEVTDVGDDRAVVRLDAGDAHLNPHGTVHGGAIASLADAAMGAAVAQPDVAPVTVQLNLTYLEPAKPGVLTATAEVRRRGSRITIVEADIADEGGSSVAHAVATFTTIA